MLDKKTFQLSWLN